MKKIGLFFLICSAILSAKAQDSVLFKIKYLPDHVYQMSMKADTGAEMAFFADPTTMAQIKAKGNKQTTTSQEIITKNAEIITGPITDKGVFEVTIVTKPETSTVIKDGEIQRKIKIKSNEQTIKGEGDVEGKLNINFSTGVRSETQVKVMARAIVMISKMQGEIEFPEKPMRVGDSFTMDVPMGIPENEYNLEATAKSTYTLIDIKNDNAYFDTSISTQININGQKNGIVIKATGQGSGTGKVVYSIKNNFITSLMSDMDMYLRIASNNRGMNLKIQIKSDIQNTIAALK